MFTRLHGNLGEVRQAGVPSERQDAAKGVDAAHVLSRMGTPKAAQYVRQGDAYSIRNVAGLELSGRVGGGRIFSTVKLNGRKLGEYTGMWCDRLGEKLAWHENGKVVSADWREEAGRGVLRVTFEVGSTPTRIVRQTQDITVFADRPWFLCSLATLQNVGTEPIELYMFYFREHPAFAIDPDASTAKRVPNLWKEPEQDTWLSIAGDAYFGGCSFAPTVSSIRHWVMPGTKSLHPDAGFVPESPLVLQPAETHDPKGKTWMVAICGLDGKEGWQKATKQIEDVAQLSDE